MTNITRKYVPCCQKQHVSGRSYRYGATTKVHEHPDTSHPELIAIGGWKATDNSHNYTVCSTAILQRPMRVLAGWPHVKKAHEPPRLCCLGDGEQDIMSNLLDKLYVTNLPEFQRGGRLRPLLRVVLATNIKNFNAKYLVLGANNRAIKRMIQQAEVCGIGYEKLKEMSSIMENDFRLRNTVTVNGGESLEVMLQKSIEMNAILLSKMSDLQTTIRSLHQQTANIETGMEVLQNQSWHLQPNTQPVLNPSTPQHKRKSPPEKEHDRNVRPRHEPSSPAAMPTQQVTRSPIVVMANRAVSAVRQIRAQVGLACVRADARFKAVTGKTNQASPFISDVIIDLVERGMLCNGTAYSSTIPSVTVFGDKAADSSSKNKYLHALKAAEMVMSKEQNKLFRSINPDMAPVKNEVKNVDKAVVAWVLGKLGEEESNRNNKALVFGVGNKVNNLTLFG